MTIDFLNAQVFDRSGPNAGHQHRGVHIEADCLATEVASSGLLCQTQPLDPIPLRPLARVLGPSGQFRRHAPGNGWIVTVTFSLPQNCIAINVACRLSSCLATAAATRSALALTIMRPPSSSPTGPAPEFGGHELVGSRLRRTVVTPVAPDKVNDIKPGGSASGTPRSSIRRL